MILIYGQDLDLTPQLHKRHSTYDEYYYYFRDFRHLRKLVYIHYQMMCLKFQDIYGI